MNHTVCKQGAAVRLHGYAPARVERIEREESGRVVAHCRITARHKRGPHGYTLGERVRVSASEAVPRDCIRTMRGSGRLVWPAFSVEG